MQVIAGTDGSLYRCGDPYRFVAPLEDCGDGFDWRMADPALRFWVEEPVVEADVGGVWVRLDPLVVHARSGRVGFGRCLRGSRLRASGVCLPLALLADGLVWELRAQVTLRPRSELGREDAQHTTVAGRQTVRVDGAVDGAVLARLPFQGGVFVGRGDSTRDGSGSVLTLNREGVTYVPC